MVRSISPASQAKLDQNFGTEPAFIIEIQWVDDGSIYTYSDKDITADEGKILEVSGLDNTVVIQGVQGGTSSDSQQISVTLDDTDSTIKDIMDKHDIHKQQAWVYQWFQGLDTSEKFLIFKGQISSPMQWNEGDRTVSFDILTRIEDAEVGFSMEEGDFGRVPEDLIGKPWPLVFGAVRLVPALQTKSPTKGFLKGGFGVKDYMLAPKWEQAGRICCPFIFIGYKLFVSIFGAFADPQYRQDVNCTCKVRAVRCEMIRKINAQTPFELSQIEIVGGELFPQAQFIVLDIDGARITGSFTGTFDEPTNFFDVVKRVHPKAVQNNPEIPPIRSFKCDYEIDPDTQATLDRELSRKSGAISSIGGKICKLPEDCGGWQNTTLLVNLIEDEGETTIQTSWNYLSSFEEAGFFWAEPGAEVRLADDNELVYIVNILPSTVHTVKAWRTFTVSNLRRLVTVPNTYYTVRQSDFGVYTTTEVVFDRPLSSRSEGWEDEIFVTLTSSVGPNTVDIMEWLITKYTPFTWDSTFAEVKARVENYPMNFVVPGRKNVFELLKDMAFQGRMALVLRDDTFHLKYLSEEPDEDGTIGESDVIQNSLVLDHTNTEDLVTKMVIDWKPEQSLDEPYKVILRHNGRKFGIHEETFDFYCYNFRELVIKSGTFWLIRLANTWRKVICQTPISKLAMESLDGCFITLPDIGNGAIKCRVETATYNSESHTIDFVLQTPVLAGSRDPYLFHYPADIAIEDLHPTIEDIQFGNQGGGGPGVDVEAPEGHVLEYLGNKVNIIRPGPSCNIRTSFSNPGAWDKACRADQGDEEPTDEGDKKQETEIDEDNSTVPEEQSPVDEFSDAWKGWTENSLLQEGRNNDMQGQLGNNLNTGTGNGEGAGGNGGAGAGGSDNTGADNMKDNLDNLPDPDDLSRCHYDVVVTQLTLSLVRISNGETCPGQDECDDPGGWCYCNSSGIKGCAVGNTVDTYEEIFAFDTPESAQAFAADMRGIQSGPGEVGSNHPTSVVTRPAQPPGCEPYEEPGGGIVGYRGSGRADNDGNERTVIGLDGFGNDDYSPKDPCST